MTPFARSHVRTRAACTLVVSIAVGLGLHRLRASGLPTPPVGDLQTLHAWIDEHGTVVAAMSALRLAAMALAAYVATVATASLLASFAVLPRSLDRAVRRITPRALRSALGIGVLGAVALPLAEPVAATTPRAPVLVAVVDAEAEPREEPPVLEWVGAVPAPSDIAPTPSAAPSTAVLADPTPPVTAPAPSHPTPSAERTWEVRPGDHFWAIADAVVREHHANATEAEVARYWRTLIDANRDRLVVKDNPDLVLPGQVLTVPALW